MLLGDGAGGRSRCCACFRCAERERQAESASNYFCRQTVARAESTASLKVPRANHLPTDPQFLLIATDNFLQCNQS